MLKLLRQGRAWGSVRGTVPEGLVPDICTRCIEIMVSLVVRASIATWVLSCSLTPMPRTQLSGEVPHDWPEERQGKMSRVDTLPRL